MQIARILDLTMPIYHNFPGNPMLPPTRLDVTHNFAADGFCMERLDIPTHAGTHIDAPSHMVENGISLDKIPLSRFMGWAVVVDLTHKKAGEPIVTDDLAKYAERIEGSDFVLLYTGWGERVGFSKEYVFGSPWLCADAAKWLVDKGVSGVGIDHMSVSGMEEEQDRLTHEVLLGAGVLIIEGLVMEPELLEEERWFLIVLPLSLSDASGAPARVVAVCMEA